MKWEYKVIDYFMGAEYRNATQENEKTLQELGEDGWELVAIDGHIAYFKMSDITDDIFEGLPIRWAFHIWLTGGQWEFDRWRDYMLKMAKARPVWKVLDEYRQKRSFLLARHFLEAHNATTLIGLIYFYQNCIKDYKTLVK